MLNKAQCPTIYEYTLKLNEQVNKNLYAPKLVMIEEIMQSVIHQQHQLENQNRDLLSNSMGTAENALE